MPPTLEESIKPTPELLYLLCGDPVELSAVLAGMQPPDIAEALRELEPEAAAKVLAALPFDLAEEVGLLVGGHRVHQVGGVAIRHLRHDRRAVLDQLGLVEDLDREVERQRGQDLRRRLGFELPKRFGSPNPRR